MYEKNADIMDSLRNAKNSVADGAMSLLQKIRGSSANDGVSALPPEAQQAIGNGVAALPESARKTVESLRGQPMENLAEKATKLLGEGGRKVRAELPSMPSMSTGGALSEGHKGGILPGIRRGIGEGVLGGIGSGVMNTGLYSLLNLITKGKAKLKPSDLAFIKQQAIGMGAASGVYGGYKGYTDTDPIRDMILGRPSEKAGEWTPAPSFSANMPLPEKKPNPFVQGKKPSAKADASGAEAALAKLGSQDNCSPSRSAAGDSKGVKYKQQTEDHATGTAAFDSLDKYLRMAKKAALESSDKKKKKIKWYGITLPEDQKRMAEEKYDEMNSSQDNKNKAMAMAMDKYKEMSKKAGLNDFQSNFFGRLIQEGINEHEMYEAIKQAGDQFGYKVGKELNRGLEKLSNWGAIGKGLMTGAKYLGAGALGAGAGVAASGAVQKGVQNGVQQGVKDGVQQGVQNVGNNAINSAGNFMNNAMGNPSQNGDNMHRVRSNIPEPTGNQYQAVRSNIPNTNGNPFQNVLNAGMQHFGNMMTGAKNMTGANGLGGGFTGNGMGKQSREKKAVNWVGAAQAAAKYLGTGLARPGAAVKRVYDAAKSVGSAGPSMPSISRGIKGVLNDPTLRSQAWTGAGTGATNPFTGAFTPSSDPDAGWGDYAARVGGSALAGAGAGLLGGKGVQDVMKRMYAGSLAGSTADLGAGAFGIDTGGLGGKIGFLGAGASPAKMPKWMGAKANRFAGGYDPVDMGMGFTIPGRQGDTVTALSKLDPFSLIGKGYTSLVKPNVRPALDAMKANKRLTAGIGLGTAGIGTGAYIGNKAVSGINDASERMNAQMNMLRNETHNNLSGIRQDLGGGMGGIGQFFEENKHWLMPALLAGGGALAGGAMGGGTGAALGGLSLPALYMMHQNGMFGGGGAANPLQAPPAKANYAQQQQQHAQEQVDKQIAARNLDPRLASPTAKPKTAGDRAVRLMRHFAKN
jgi:hypothetical protein